MLWARRQMRQARDAASAAVVSIEERADALAAEFAALTPDDMARATEVVDALERLDDERISAQMALTAATQAVMGETVGKAWQDPARLWRP